MSTSNFKTQNNFPLFATSIFDGGYEKDETGAEIWYDPDYYLADIAENEIKEFNEQLKYFSLSLESGYWQGVQTVLNRKADVKDACYCEYTDDYTAEQWAYKRREEKGYYNCYDLFDMSYSARKKAEQREIRKIVDFCRTVLKAEYDFVELVVTARFSNGETLYKKIA